jgi:hypothetical protein
MRVAALLLVLVQVHPSHIVRLTDHSQLRATCRTDRTDRACTDFVGRRLTAACAADGDRWRIDARAQFIPFVYLWDVSALFHERAHIDDVRGEVARHLDALTAQRFATPAACEGTANAASAGFESEMNAMLRRSNARLH